MCKGLGSHGLVKAHFQHKITFVAHYLRALRACSIFLLHASQMFLATLLVLACMYQTALRILLCVNPTSVDVCSWADDRSKRVCIERLVLDAGVLVTASSTSLLPTIRTSFSKSVPKIPFLIDYRSTVTKSLQSFVANIANTIWCDVFMMPSSL